MDATVKKLGTGYYAVLDGETIVGYIGSDSHPKFGFYARRYSRWTGWLQTGRSGPNYHLITAEGRHVHTGSLPQCKNHAYEMEATP